MKNVDAFMLLPRSSLVLHKSMQRSIHHHCASKKKKKDDMDDELTRQYVVISTKMDNISNLLMQMNEQMKEEVTISDQTIDQMQQERIELTEQINHLKILVFSRTVHSIFKIFIEK
jgi:hypothetical protein